MDRLQRLLELCGGLYFGADLQAQLEITAPLKGAGTAGLEHYEQLRFSCTPQVFQLIREEPRRFPPEHTRYSKPIPGQSSWQPGPLDQLEPNPSSDSHPYPVELLLPQWTVQEDWDLRNWLFRWGPGIRMESPISLRELHQQTARDVVATYRADKAPVATAS
jgi:hypothetical protein